MNEYQSMHIIVDAVLDALRFSEVIAVFVAACTIYHNLPRLVRAMERIVALAEKE